MRVYMTNKILKKIKPSWKTFEGNLNINKYDADTLLEKVCSHCLLKSYKRVDLILINEVASSNNCNCLLQQDNGPAINLLYSTSKTIPIS